MASSFFFTLHETFHQGIFENIIHMLNDLSIEKNLLFLLFFDTLQGS